MLCRQDYWSINETAPSRDTPASQDFKLMEATEADGFVSVKFYRNATTMDSGNDVQFMVKFKYQIEKHKHKRQHVRVSLDC